MKKPLQLSSSSIQPVVELTDDLLVIEVSFTLDNGTNIRTPALVDSGANGYAFVDSSYAQSHNLPLFSTRRRTLNVVDGREAVAGDITQISRLNLSIGQHTETDSPLFVTKLGQFPIILGKAWLKRHNPYIDWRDNFLTFRQSCCHSCLPKDTFQLRVDGLSPAQIKSPIDLPPQRPVGNVKQIGAAAFHTIARKQNGVGIFAASLFEINRLLGEQTSPEFLPQDSQNCVLQSLSVQDRNKEIHQAFASGEEAGREKLAQLYNLTQEDKILVLIQNAIMSTPIDRDLDEVRQLYAQGASLEDVEKALWKMDNKRIPTDPSTVLPRHFHPALYAFDAKKGNELPPHRDCDHKIEIKEGKTPSWGPLYSMSQDELRVLKRWLEDNLQKGFIRASSSPASSPVLFAKKPGGGLRVCVDYRALNEITIKNRYPMPLLQETLDKLSKAKWFSKVDVIAGFNKIRIREGDEWMTAFRTRFGLFESLVTPFGLSNAPATFQARINEVLREYLDVFCTAFIDDVLIYSDTLEEHRVHVMKVLTALGDAGLQLDIDKCEFEVTETKYLGLIISRDGVKMDPAKVQSILEWQKPTHIKDVQAFLGFANFYRRFIKDFSKMAAPLNALTCKGKDFEWTSDCQGAFNQLKLAFTTAPVLRHFDPSREIIIETDASDYVSAGVLSQRDDDGMLHPVAFFSKKHSAQELNYEIYDKELLAIVRCFEALRPELEGSAYPITVLSDHRNLTYFMTTKDLSRRQVRWSEFLSRFDFVIRYRPAKSGLKPDALTRRPGDQALKGDPRKEIQRQIVLKSHNIDKSIQDDSLQLSPAIISSPQESDELKIDRLLRESYPTDAFAVKHIKLLKNPSPNPPRSREISLSECRMESANGYDKLLFRDRTYVPEGELREILLRLAHDQPSVGHTGRAKMYELMSRHYYWPSLSADIRRYLRNCVNCNRCKSSRYKAGLLKPLPVPAQRWTEVSVDFIGPLVKSHGFDCIMVVVCRLSKMRHYIPCLTTDSTDDLTDLFIRHVWKLHGLPDHLVSDRGPTFASALWASICESLQVKVDMSTAYHPETDGQTENANQFLEAYLRSYVNYAQSDWWKWLPLAEFAANNAMNESIGMSPFFANYGYHPRMSFGPPRPVPTAASRRVRNETLKGNKFVKKMEEITEVLLDKLMQSRITYEIFANKHRQPAPAYRVGDKVWLDVRNVNTNRPTKKLDYKYFGPFPIAEVVSSHSYRLTLPEEMKELHPVFHTTLLRPVATDPFPSQQQRQVDRPPVAIDAQGQEIWKIEAILSSRRVHGQFQYKIQWEGYDRNEISWEPLVNVVLAKASLREYHRKFPRRLKPTDDEMADALAEVGDASS